LEKIALQSSVVDPHWFQCADPDPGFYLNARIRIYGGKAMRIRILIRLCRHKDVPKVAEIIGNNCSSIQCCESVLASMRRSGSWFLPQCADPDSWSQIIADPDSAQNLPSQSVKQWAIPGPPTLLDKPKVAAKIEKKLLFNQVL
jgi:hypothetical protein